MKRATLYGLICAALTLPAFAATAADAPADGPSKAAVKKVKWSIAEKGRYHKLHEEKEKLDCKDCHSKKPLPDSTLKLRLHQPLAKDSPGPVSADACHECHGKQQKKKVTWYAPKDPG